MVQSLGFQKAFRSGAQFGKHMVHRSSVHFTTGLLAAQ
jgi:hypothetical protein